MNVLAAIAITLVAPLLWVFIRKTSKNTPTSDFA